MGDEPPIPRSARSRVTSPIILPASGGSTLRLPRLGQSIESMIAKPWDDAMLRLALRGSLFERMTEDPGWEEDHGRRGASSLRPVEGW